MNQDAVAEAMRSLRNSEAARQLRARKEREQAEREPVWFVSLDGADAVGPDTAEALLQRYAQGELGPGFLLWRQGLEEWLTIDDETQLRTALGLAVPAGTSAPGRTSAAGEDRGGVMSLSFDLPPPEEPAAAEQDERLAVRQAAPMGDRDAGAGEGAEMALLEQVSASVSTYMDELLGRIGADRVYGSEDHQRRYLGFELGVLEYYRGQVLPSVFDSEAALEEAFFGLLVYHAGEHYPEFVEQVITLWHDWLASGQLREARELGFASVREGLKPDGSSRPGHYPVAYLRRALHLPPEE